MFSDFGPFGGANGNVMDMPTSNSELPYTAPTLDSDPRYNAQYPLTTTHDMSSLQQHSNGTPLVPTSHGVIPEPLAAVLPLHSDPNSADASLATFFSNRQSIAQEPCQQRRPGGPYEFGSDAAFNDSGYEAPIPDLEDAVEERLLHDASTAFPSLPIEPASGTDPDADFATPSKVSNGDLKRSSLKPSSQNEEHGVEQARKKRKPSTTIAKPSSNQRQMAFPGRLGEGASGRCPSKVRKQSTTDQTNSTKKRLSSAGAKALRENLTDEQKRNNHVNSEQKRRDLIKQCTLDLRNLVPALRRVTLSRSVELTEARIFLEQLLRDNEEYRALAEGPGG
jgi:ubiquitin